MNNADYEISIWKLCNADAMASEEKSRALWLLSAVVRLTKYGSRSDLCLLFVEFDF
jgi:hypothetical protein